MTGLAHGCADDPSRVVGAGLVLGGLVAFVVLVYVVVVLGGGALIGQTFVARRARSRSSPPRSWPWPSTRCRPGCEASRRARVHGGRLAVRRAAAGSPRPSPAATPAEELPARMARVLAEGTGAEWAQVWLVVRRPAARSRPPGRRSATARVAPPEPAGRDEDEAAGRRSCAVRHGGELLGVLVVQERDAACR